MPLKSPAGQMTEGYVLAPRHEGGRYLSVLLTGNQHAVDFGFAVPLPDGEFDYEQLDTQQIYPNFKRPELTLDELHAELRNLPCCVSDEEGEGEGDPVNLVLVGNLDEMLAALSRGGWSFTHRVDLETVRRLAGAAISGAAYPVAPVSPLYLYERPQDIALQRARNTILQRNHLRLWLSPMRYHGKSVWVGQISRDIGTRFTIHSPYLTTHKIDPDVDEARTALQEDMIYSQSLVSLGLIKGVGAASKDTPRRNLTTDPYYTDGFRGVLIFDIHPTALTDIKFLSWDGRKGGFIEQSTQQGQR